MPERAQVYYRNHPENEPDRTRLWLLLGLGVLGIGGVAAAKAMGLDQAFSSGQEEGDSPASPNLPRPEVVRKSFSLEESESIIATEAPTIEKKQNLVFSQSTEIGQSQELDLGDGVKMINQSSRTFRPFAKDFSSGPWNGYFVRYLSHLPENIAIEFFILDQVYDLIPKQRGGLCIVPLEYIPAGAREIWLEGLNPPPKQGTLRIAIDPVFIQKEIDRSEAAGSRGVSWEYWVAEECVHADFWINSGQQFQNENQVQQEGLRRLDEWQRR